MPTQNKFIISGALIATAAVFAALTAVFSSADGLLSSSIFTYIFLIITLLLVFIALYLILPPNYLPGGIRSILALLPICKEKIKSVTSTCARCIGFPFGVIVSASLSALVFYNNVYIESLMSINFWVLIGLALLINTPTAIHGYHRRLNNPTSFDSSLFRFLMGILSGLGFFLAFLAWLRLLEFKI